MIILKKKMGRRDAFPHWKEVISSHVCVFFFFQFYKTFSFFHFLTVLVKFILREHFPRMRIDFPGTGRRRHSRIKRYFGFWFVVTEIFVPRFVSRRRRHHFRSIPDAQ
jgi:hypothetical protein